MCRIVDEEVRCPYYCSEEPQKIKCKGVQPDSWIHMVFTSKTDKNDYRNECCRGSYAESCPVAMMQLHGI